MTQITLTVLSIFPITAISLSFFLRFNHALQSGARCRVSFFQAQHEAVFVAGAGVIAVACCGIGPAQEIGYVPALETVNVDGAAFFLSRQETLTSAVPCVQLIQ